MEEAQSRREKQIIWTIERVGAAVFPETSLGVTAVGVIDRQGRWSTTSMAARRSQSFIALALLPLLVQLGQAGHESISAPRKVDPLGTPGTQLPDGGSKGNAAVAAQQQQQEQQQRLFVPLTKRARAGGPVYGVDVSEGGISRRKLKLDGVVEAEGERRHVSRRGGDLYY